mmetsp:Transcript_39923/g.113079  ORF Transcript_39923/g.113079 Transcript_39923/m.113079 type:complete len:567 (-) Transcript_39923:37-1737(-)
MSRTALRGAWRGARSALGPSTPAWAVGRHCGVRAAAEELPWPLPARRGASSAASSSTATSETTFAILSILEEREAADAPERAPDTSSTTGRVMSSSGGLLRISVSGGVAVGGAVELPEGLGFVIRYDKHGALVALAAGKAPRNGDEVRLVGTLAAGKWPAAEGGRASFLSVPELLQTGEGRSVLSMPAMPAIPRRRPVTRRLPSGLAAAESLLPLGEGHRVAFVGPPTTGKTTAASMLIHSQAPDTAIVYAAQRPRARLEQQLGPGALENPNLRVIYSDPTTDPVGARYLLPLYAMQLASRLRAEHRHVLLILDDMVALSQAAAELGSPPLGAPHVAAAALDAAGNVADAEGVRALSVVTLLDFDPDDGDLHPTLRNLWRSMEQSLDVCFNFDLRLAADGMLPAIDVEQLLACGPAPVYQAALFKRLRGELLRSLMTDRDRRERMEVGGQLGLHKEPQDQEDLGSARVARALLAHTAARPLPELAIVLTAALVYHFPQYGRKPSRTAVGSFQDAIVALVRDGYPRLWETLLDCRSLTDAQAAETLQQLGGVLLQHRFDFQLTCPER